MKKMLLLLLVLPAGVIGAMGNGTNSHQYNAAPDSSLPKARKDTLSSSSAFTSARMNPDSLNGTPSLQPIGSIPVGVAAPKKDEGKIYDNLNQYVINYINDFAKDYYKHLQLIQNLGEPYFVLIDKVFREHGIPPEMKYLAVIESGLNTNAVSRVGAVGTWQFMAGTARLLGLTVGRKIDERRNFYKSTSAAARYLNQLYDTLQDWLLVVAAYNCGPGSVLKAIKASGSNNYWKLQHYLPAESKGHVLKFLATAYIMDRFANFFGLHPKPASVDPADAPAPKLSTEELSKLSSLTISGKYSMPVIAKYLAMDITELNRLNPGFEKMMGSAANSYELRLPADKMKIFSANKNNILNESVQLLLESNAKATTQTTAYPAANPLPNSHEKAIRHLPIRRANAAGRK